MADIVVFDARHANLETGKLWFLAEERGVGVVGMGSLVDVGKPWPWMNDLFVIAHWRRKGIGRQLMQARIDFVRPLECLGVNAAFDPKAVESIALAESLGFKRSYDYPSGVQLFTLYF